MSAIFIKNVDELNKMLTKNDINISKTDVEQCYQDYKMMTKEGDSEKPVEVSFEELQAIESMLEQDITNAVIKSKLPEAEKYCSNKDYQNLQHISKNMDMICQMARDCWNNGKVYATDTEFEGLELEMERNDYAQYYFSLGLDPYWGMDEEFYVNYSTLNFGDMIDMARQTTLTYCGTDVTVLLKTLGDDFKNKIDGIMHNIEDATEFDIYNSKEGLSQPSVTRGNLADRTIHIEEKSTEEPKKESPVD